MQGDDEAATGDDPCVQVAMLAGAAGLEVAGIAAGVLLHTSIHMCGNNGGVYCC
jgi:hypothetical protein